MFAQNPDGSNAYASGDGRQSVLSAAAELEQQQRILEAAFRADRARENSGTETEGRVAEREFIGQYNAQDDQSAQDSLYSSSEASTDPNVSYLHETQDASDMTTLLSADM